ncbi:MAG TPA: hypothetical protein VGK73_10110 [Polyangiaceae bacterium]
MLDGFTRSRGWIVVPVLAALIAVACDDPKKKRRGDDDDNQGGETSATGGSAGKGTTGGSSGDSASGATGGGANSGGTGNATSSGGSGATGGGVSSGGSGDAPSTGGTGFESGGSSAANGGSGASEGAVGGTAGTESGGSGGSGGDVPAPECGTGWHVFADGYVTAPGASGCWKGWAFTATNLSGTIAPANYTGCTEPCALCASGSVAADLEFGGIGILGFSLSETYDAASKAAVVPSGGSLTVSFENPLGAPLRVQILGPSGSTSETDRWCYNLVGTSGTTTIPYSSFNTHCWSGDGYAYSGEPLVTAQLLVPGTDESSIAFDICLTGMSDGAVAQ